VSEQLGLKMMLEDGGYANYVAALLKDCSKHQVHLQRIQNVTACRALAQMLFGGHSHSRCITFRADTTCNIKYRKIHFSGTTNFHQKPHCEDKMHKIYFQLQLSHEPHWPILTNKSKDSLDIVPHLRIPPSMADPHSV